MLLLALLPALVAVALFAATCNLQRGRPKAPETQLPGLSSPGDDRTPPPPNFGAIA